MSSFRLYSSLRPNVLGSFKRSPLSPSFFTRQSRTFITDANPVVYKPSQAESWKRFGITAVSTHGVPLFPEHLLNSRDTYRLRLPVLSLE